LRNCRPTKTSAQGAPPPPGFAGILPRKRRGIAYELFGGFWRSGRRQRFSPAIVLASPVRSFALVWPSEKQNDSGAKAICDSPARKRERNADCNIGRVLTTRTLRSANRLSRPAPTPHDALPHTTSHTFVVICRSSAVHRNRFPFRPLSEISPKLSPRSVGEVDSGHRRTKCEIMTSDWCSEAGWFGCRFEPGQAGKVWQA
jgi:hypothetical protein